MTVLHSERFIDQAPRAVYATLLEENQYLASPRTFYRLLAQAGESGERRAQRRHPSYVKPELLATAPNQLWSWDITKLRGPVKWSYYYLYVILDVFSRCVVGWMVAPRESSQLAKRLIHHSYKQHAIVPGQLTLHADRGSSMKSKPVALLLSDLGVNKTHSRPHVSDDNPYSEAQFKTMKYRPDFPGRFGCIEDARAHCQTFFHWYNHEHRHSGIALLTPADVHTGRTEQCVRTRQATLDSAFEAHPNRFKGRPPVAARPPQAVWINKPAPAKTDDTPEQT
jgi:putative transposase